MDIQDEKLLKRVNEQTRAIAVEMGDPTEKPLLRGASHRYGFWLALGASIWVLAHTAHGLPFFAGFIGLGSVTLMLGISGAYHTYTWHPEVRVWIRRVDHTMIFVVIAGIYTPYALLSFDTPLSSRLLTFMWGATVLGAAFKLVWLNAPSWLSVALYLGVGWASVLIYNELFLALGPHVVYSLLATGIIMSLGAVMYALERPNPWPGVFGYHELFHIATLICVFSHFIVIAWWVLPAASGA